MPGAGIGNIAVITARAGKGQGSLGRGQFRLVLEFRRQAVEQFLRGGNVACLHAADNQPAHG